MPRGMRSKHGGLGSIFFIFVVAFVGVILTTSSYASQNTAVFVVLVSIILAVVFIYLIISSIIKSQREALLSEILESLHLKSIDSFLKSYDDKIIVKSRQALNNYDYIKYLKENNHLDHIKKMIKTKTSIKTSITSFLKKNEYSQRTHYDYVAEKLRYYVSLSNGFRVDVVYITPAGNNRGQKLISITESIIKKIDEHPEYLMTKGEYNKILKQQAKEKLEEKKHLYYDRVNSIIDFANESKDDFVVKSRVKLLDELIQQLFDRTINSIQKIKQIDSNEWDMLDNYIAGVDNQVQQIVCDDKIIRQYYESDDFARIKEACQSLNDSRKEFNEYIEEKAQSISELFGKRIVRNETQNDDTYNYIRAYKKTITPFTAEVSSAVFGSAENNPIDYVIKSFYPNKALYEEQIQKLRLLIEELETLKEARIIIDEYKKDYDQYLSGVPDYVIDNDENGFYSRLGLATIDEAVLNIEYRFVYTSNGGMAQRSFSVPMDEENIIELINRLEGKLSLQAQTKEQRALMTTKLRIHIKERDNFTCCQCGNSTTNEPNLLLEVDHIVPIAKGGLTIEDNLQTLCWKCNRSKGAKLNF